MDDGPERGEFTAEFGDGFGAVVFLAAVAVAVDGEQYDGFDLLETVQDAAGAEVGGARGPDTADGRGGEQRGDGLRDVGEVAADAVSGAYAEGAQLRGECGDLAAQLGPADRGRFMRLVDMEEGRFMGASRVLGGAQGVFRVVEGGAGEPLGSGHGAIAEDSFVRGGEPDVEPVGDSGPEGLQVVDGPAVQRGVAALGRGSVPLGRPGLEAGDTGGGDPVGSRLPEGCGAFCCCGHGAAPGLTRRWCGASTRGLVRRLVVWCVGSWCASVAYTRAGGRVTRLSRTMPCDRPWHQASSPMAWPGRHMLSPRVNGS